MRDTDDDDVAADRNKIELRKEIQRAKPRKEIILALSRQTFKGQRNDVLSEAADVCVASLLTEYPELNKEYVVNAALVVQLPLLLIIPFNATAGTGN